MFFGKAGLFKGLKYVIEGHAMKDGVSLYLELLKKCVSNFIYDDDHDLRMGTVNVGQIKRDNPDFNWNER